MLIIEPTMNLHFTWSWDRWQVAMAQALATLCSLAQVGIDWSRLDQDAGRCWVLWTTGD